MKYKKLQLVILLILVATLLWGCGMSASSNMAGDAAPREEASQEFADSSLGTNTSGTVLPENRKLIRTVNMDAQTMDMDSLLPGVEQQVASLGGYLESREVYSGSNSSSQWRTANLTIRIPSDQADALLSQIESSANVTFVNETLDDVTLDYVATESRVTALETEHERLLTLMEQAENLTDLLEIEARLTDVVAELETVASQLRLYDNLIDYTTIHLSIRQVTELTTPEDEMTVWQRISTGFMNTLNGLGETLVDFFVWLIVASPVLLVLAIPVVLVIVLLRMNRKKKNARKAPPADNASNG